MSEKILIFQDLAEQFSSLIQEMGRLGVGVVLAKDGEEALQKASKELPKVAILGVAMPGAGGMECCRKLKAPEDATQAPKVVLVASSRSALVKERARDAKCDLLFPLGEPDSTLTEFVLSSLSIPPGAVPKVEPSASTGASGKTFPELPESSGISGHLLSDPEYVLPQPTRKVATRFDIPGFMTYVVAGREKRGWSINASGSGILFAVDEEYPVGTEVRLRFSLPDGSQFELPASTFRVQKLKVPVSHLPIGVGAKFAPLTEFQKDRLQLLIESRSLALSAQLKPEFLRSVFDDAEKIIQEALAAETIPPEVDLCLEGIHPFEREAFASDGTVRKCVRNLVGIRMRCSAFRLFLPSLKTDPKTFGPIYIPILAQILEKADGIESDVDFLVREAVLSGDDNTRQGLNDASNRLYQAKLKLLYGVDEMIRLEGLGPGEKEIIGKVKARIDALHALSATESDVVKYNPRTKIAIQSAKEARKEPAKEGTSSKLSAKEGDTFRPSMHVRLPFLFALAIAIVAIFVLPQKPKVDLNQLQLPIRFDKVEQVDESIVLYMQLQDWKYATRKNRDEVLRRLEVFLLANRLQQAEIRAQNGTRLAALLGGEGDRGQIFTRRIYIAR